MTMLSQRLLRSSVPRLRAAGASCRFFTSLSTPPPSARPLSASFHGIDSATPAALRTADGLQQDLPHGDLTAQGGVGLTGVAAMGGPILIAPPGAGSNPLGENIVFLWGDYFEKLFKQVGEADHNAETLQLFAEFSLIYMLVHLLYLEPVRVRERMQQYAASWKVGHHIRSHRLLNPLKKDHQQLMIEARQAADQLTGWKKQMYDLTGKVEINNK
ncbi:unnamed protein product [Vitrella brassicaformis CCMP3155]|uniref:Uncharacterized protein n=1 Tax=Vitrella brassicaformis (strain CCMP3155) TaxID=1169540 RepID=A0A0G4EBJ7_VITBC|nr:unnamed protein product [Vitrella brassicaformis CCMP3155]|mmetsp:Transcript_52980/g.133375  ORF Transcript_52980/g.133375 Transcript_52980/m.133375 type:complete len:215 (-) Transcript_52980:645-1289(-)|eukprot:CEL92898.1 unnamed protein product [Vitrella brassicaformis CCMP3155]